MHVYWLLACHSSASSVAQLVNERDALIYGEVFVVCKELGQQTEYFSESCSDAQRQGPATSVSVPLTSTLSELER